MEPVMDNMSLTMIRMYQPFTNSNLSDQGTSSAPCFLRWRVYSWAEQDNRYRTSGKGFHHVREEL